MQTDRIQREFRVVRTLLRILGPHKRLLPVVIFLGLLASLFEGVSLSLPIPLLHALTVRAGWFAGKSPVALTLQRFISPVPPALQFPVIVSAIFLGVCLKNLINYGNVASFSFVESRVSHDVRVRLFARILELPLAEAEDTSSGNLINLLETEAWRTSEALKVLFGAITSGCTAVVFVPLLFLLSWRLALLALGTVSVIPVVISMVTRNVRALGDRVVVANTELATRTWASLNGLRVIHSYGQQSFELKRFAKASRKARDISLHLSIMAARTAPVSEILVAAVIGGLAMLVGAKLIDVATLSAFVLILYRLQPRVRELVSARVSLAELGGAVLEVARFLEANVPAQAGDLSPEGWGVVRFEGVTFRHSGQERPALDNVSFEFSRGSTLAIVGPSGAGKSTVLDLLLGFRHPEKGRIVIDGTPIENIDGGAWRSKLSVVSQDPYIFDDTVRFNILYGRPESEHGEIVQAAELADADSFIRTLTNGYDTLVGERGVHLSGGEGQRVVLARALIRVPEILILDEATNALDSVTEQAFQRALSHFARNHSVVIVAHRLSTIRQADHIVVLNQGRVVEQGDFSTLLARNGLFTRMYELQQFGQTAECDGVTAD